MADPDALRIVLFGPRHAGKSRLLQAFLAQTGSDAIPELARESQGHLGIRIYRSTPTFEGQPSRVFLDYDGQVADEILDQPTRLQVAPRSDARVAAVLNADAILLTVDSAVDELSLREQFHTFTQFLEQLRTCRCEERECGGLPVFLTLTKCDQLYQPGDHPQDWEGRILARRQQIRQDFEDFLAEQSELADLPYGFGDIVLEDAATAVTLPQGPGFSSIDGAYGVEELLQSATDAAIAYRDVHTVSQRHLRRTVTGSGAILGLMLTSLLALLTLSPGAEEDRLIQQLRLYQDREPVAAVRLADRYFRKNRSALQSIREDFAFTQLPRDSQRFVLDRLTEFEQYQRYRERFRPSQPGPSEVRSLAELGRLERALGKDLAPPAEYAIAWSDTDAVRLWNRWKSDLPLLRQTELVLHDWYRGLIRRGTLELGVSSLDARWQSDVSKLFAESEHPLFARDDAIPGSEKLPFPRGGSLTYRTVYEFDRIEQARLDWLDTRDRLTQLRQMALALGMLTSPESRPFLELPEPGATPSLTLARERLQELSRTLPLEPESLGLWSTSRFPDPIRSECQKRLRRAYDTGVRHVRRLIAERLPTVESLEAWRILGGNLTQDENLKAWGVLLRQLAWWAEPERPAEDPLTEIATFLRRDSFAFDLQALDLFVPDDLRDRRLLPRGNLVLKASADRAYRLEGEPRREPGVSIYRFVPEGHDGRFTLKPTDPITAEMLLGNNDVQYRVEWLRSRSLVYLFDRLSQEPQMRRESVPGVVEPATGVRLQALPQTGMPTLPVLFPQDLPRK